MVDASQGAFLVVISLVGAQRLWEVRRSHIHELAIRTAGGREHAPGQMTVMAALHVAWILSMGVEVVALHRPLCVAVAVPAAVLFILGQALRIVAMRTLGTRWTVRIMTLPGVPAVGHGVFRWLRHPNYVGVALEIFALPLVHGAWVTSALFTVANGVLLRARIKAEEAALTEDSCYDAMIPPRARLVSRLFG